MSKFNIINRKVAQLTKDGKIVEIWNSITEASICTGIDRHNITNCCYGKLKTAGGFRWSFR